MKVLVICFTIKEYMPYLKKYVDILRERQAEYDIIYFDREVTRESQMIEHEIYFHHYMPIDKVFFNKVIPYIKYMFFCKKVLRRQSYDKLIILTTAPAILLYRECLTRFAGKFIFDYRDYSFEKYSFYNKMVNKIIKASSCSFISSKGYLKFLDQSPQLYLTHNISNFTEEELTVNDLKYRKVIRIGFVGCVRYYDVNCKIIDALANDKEFQLYYIGSTYHDCDLRDYCNKNGVQNVFFQDKYENNQKPVIYEQLDMINSVYSLNSDEVSQAIPNRLYDALLFKKPILTTRGTYLSEIVEQYKLGQSIDVNVDNIKEAIKTYIDTFDKQVFLENSSRLLDKVREDEENFKELVRNFLDGQGDRNENIICGSLS